MSKVWSENSDYSAMLSLSEWSSATAISSIKNKMRRSK